MKMRMRPASATIFFLFIFTLLFPDPNLQATCSPHIGLAKINEVNESNPAYVEISVLDSTIISSGAWQNWTMDICSILGRRNRRPCRNGIAVQDYYRQNGQLLPGDTSGNSWLVTPESTFNWNYLILNRRGRRAIGGMTITLRDGNGDIIDQLDISNYDRTPVPCTIPYGTEVMGTNRPNLSRLPDAVGGWRSSWTSTPNAINAPAIPDAPIIIPNDVTVSPGKDAVFTVSLTDPTTGALTTTYLPVTIVYKTLEQTAIGGKDYVEKSGTITIPARVSSVNLPISTLAQAKLGSQFSLQLLAVTSASGITSNAIIGDDFGQATIGGTLIDHYEIHHDGLGLSCQPETVTIKACTDALTPCSELSSASEVDLSTSAGNWLTPNPFSFSGSGSVMLRNTAAGTATIGLSATDPTSTVKCYKNGILDATCQLIFHDSGFVFNVADAASGSDQTVAMKAVRLDKPSETCVPLFQNKDLSVDFGFAYDTPNSNPYGSQAIIDGSSFTARKLTKTLSFDNNGATSFKLSYPDAGKLKFSASYNDGKAFATGNDNAIFYPAKFSISADDQTWTATDENSLKLKKAGENFDLTIKALNSLGKVTPNYSGTIKLSAANIAPTGGVAGKLGSVSATLPTGGTATITQSYDEVGIMRITTEDPDYQGYKISGTSDNIGRFTPANFRIISGLTIAGTLNHADSGFSYLGHEIPGYATDPSFTIEALAVDGSRTENYRGAYAKLTAADSKIKITNPTADKVVTTQPLEIDRVAAKLTDNDNGTLTYTFGDDGVTYTRSATATAPLTNPRFDFLVTRLDDGEVATDSPANGSIPVSGGTELRYGRLVIENNFGPETAPIGMPISTEYWDGGQWLTNGMDSSSRYSYIKPNDVGITTTENENGTPTTPTASIATPLSITGGAGSLTLTPASDPPDPGGTVDITLTAPTWLKFDWNNDSSQDDPSATATFGIYRGRDRVISWEELPAQ
jgi:MSHA biogenesis protein MshQ